MCVCVTYAELYIADVRRDVCRRAGEKGTVVYTPREIRASPSAPPQEGQKGTWIVVIIRNGPDDTLYVGQRGARVDASVVRVGKESDCKSAVSSPRPPTPCFGTVKDDFKDTRTRRRRHMFVHPVARTRLWGWVRARVVVLL